MNRLQKIVKFLFLLVLQVFLTMVIGFSFLYAVDKNHSDGTVYVSGMPYTHTEILNSKQEIMKEVNEKIAEQFLNIEYGKDLVGIIRYTDIDAYPDWDDIFLLTERMSGDRSFKAFLRRNFIPTANNVPLEILFDKNKLETRVEEIAALVDSDCVDAGARLESDRIVRKKHRYGRKVDKNRVLASIRERVEKGLGGSVQLRDGADVFSVAPNIDDDAIADIQSILSEYVTVIKDKQDTLSVHIAAKAIDGKFIRQGSGFSFNRCLFDENSNEFLNEPYSDGYNQVASTLYAALLLTGLEKSDITKTQAQEIPGYISPGLEVSICRGERDLSFNNSLGTNIMIFSRIEDNKLRVVIAGRKNEDVSVEILPETVQTFLPGTVTNANSRLAFGETIVINPGREGAQVKVTRNIKSQNRNTSEVVSIHTYEPVDRVVEVGTSNRAEK